MADKTADSITVTVMQDGFTYSQNGGWKAFEYGVDTRIQPPEPKTNPFFKDDGFIKESPAKDPRIVDDDMMMKRNPLDSVPDYVKEAVEQAARELDKEITIKPVYPDAYYENQASGMSGGNLNLVAYMPSYKFSDAQGNQIEIEGTTSKLFDSLNSDRAAGIDNPGLNGDTQNGTGLTSMIGKMEGGQNVKVEPSPDVGHNHIVRTEHNDIAETGHNDIVRTERVEAITVEEIERLEGDTLEEKAQNLEDKFNDVARGGNDIDISIVCDVPEETGPQQEQEIEVLHFTEEEAVRNVQNHLIGTGHEKVGDAENNPDGMFGKGTSRALEDTLKQIQEENGLDVTGEFNEATRDAMIEQIDGLEDGAYKDSMEGFVQGLDSLQEKEIEGHSALDRLYNPETNDSSTPAVDASCEITVKGDFALPPAR